MSDVVVSCSRVWKSFQKGRRTIDAVADVTLSVAAGEFLCLRGSSGSGKSTLLNLIAGVDRPSRGEITTCGLPLASLTSSQLSRLRRERIGFVFQELFLISHLTARDNVVLPLMFDGLDEKVLMERGEAMLSRVGLEGRADHLPAELSHGERQRVAIARALIAMPVLLLADEPTASLDEANGSGIARLLRALSRDTVTVIAATHDRGLADQSDRVVTMETGRLVGG